MVTGSVKETKLLMMQAAVTIIADYGFEGFSTRRCALEAGVSEGLLYRYFSRKGDLLEECYLMISRQIAESLEDLGAEELYLRDLSDSVYLLWTRCYELFVRDRRTLAFFRVFRTSRYHTAEVSEKARSIYEPGIRLKIEALDDFYGIALNTGWEMRWWYILDSAAAAAYLVQSGAAKSRGAVETETLDLIVNGLRGTPVRSTEEE